MTIREIEALSGMTRANIRFYEAEGLLNPVRAPWRRFFARQLDLAIYELCLNAILMLGFHINTERISSGTQTGTLTFSVAWISVLALVIMLFVEPLLLSVFATTPGK